MILKKIRKVAPKFSIAYNLRNACETVKVANTKQDIKKTFYTTDEEVNWEAEPPSLDCMV